VGGGGAYESPRPDAVPSLLADGTVIRTHVLRSTWHYALAEDVGWLLDLSGQRVRGVVTSMLMLRGFDDAAIRLVEDLVTTTLADGPTRRGRSSGTCSRRSASRSTAWRPPRSSP
jgi:hypothetical protein